MPSLQVFFYICDFLEVTPQEFFDVGNPNPEKLRDVIGDAKKMSDQSIEHIVAVMKEMNGVKNKKIKSGEA